MSTNNLLVRWKSHNDRLHWIKENREELEAATGLSIPNRMHELENWLDGHKGVVTRKLKAAETTAEAETAEPSGDEEDPDDG